MIKKYSQYGSSFPYLLFIQVLDSSQEVVWINPEVWNGIINWVSGSVVCALLLMVAMFTYMCVCLFKWAEEERDYRDLYARIQAQRKERCALSCVLVWISASVLQFVFTFCVLYQRLADMIRLLATCTKLWPPLVKYVSCFSLHYLPFSVIVYVCVSLCPSLPVCLFLSFCLSLLLLLLLLSLSLSLPLYLSPSLSPSPFSLSLSLSVAIYFYIVIYFPIIDTNKHLKENF